MEATHKISACYFPAKKEIELTWEDIKEGTQVSLTVEVGSDKGNQIADCIMPCVYIGAVTKEKHYLQEILNQCHNEGNGEYTLPAWFIQEIRSIVR